MIARLACPLLISTLVVTTAHADADLTETAPRVSMNIGLGLGVVPFPGDGITETVIPLHFRWRRGAIGFDVGRDSFPSNDALLLAAMGIYRTGVIFMPIEGDFRPYAYGRLSFLLAGAEDDMPHVWNVGPHVAAGAGFEYNTGPIGVFVEAGLFGDVGGAFIVPAASAGAFIALN